MESLDMLANNLANSETKGYKADREFYNLFTSPEAAGDAYDPTTLPDIEKSWTDYAQGSLNSTGNPLDIALEGKGFFVVNGPNGPLYTRNGAFRLAADGTLVTADNYAVRGSNGAPIRLAPGASFEVLPDGSINQNGQQAGRFEVVDLANAQALVKRGDTYFQAATTPPDTQPAHVTVRQGALEGSNVGAAESAVRLVSVMRQFEMLQRALKVGDEMNSKAVENVARVGS